MKGEAMEDVRFEDLMFGVLIAVVAGVSLLVALIELRRKPERRDPEIAAISGGFAVFLGIAALVLCTGWINYLPLPR